MATKQRQRHDPQVDFGFHAVMPRIYRTGYKHLTGNQKWFLVCLKDLCGEHGTCFRTVPVLAEETGLSTGLISESIPLLHEAGLIHAEKKKRSSGGKPVWHITIVDVWGANAKAHPTKRSHSEQPEEKNVHSVNENVHRVNEKGQERSHSEGERSQNRDRSSIRRSSIISEAVSLEGEAPQRVSSSQQESSPTPVSPLVVASSSSTPVVNASSSGHQGEKSLVPTEQTSLDAMYQAMSQKLSAIYGFPCPIEWSDKNNAAMRTLVNQQATPDTLGEVIQHLWDDPDHFYRKNLNPSYIAANYLTRLGMVRNPTPLSTSSSGQQPSGTRGNGYGNPGTREFFDFSGNRIETDLNVLYEQQEAQRQGVYA